MQILVSKSGERKLVDSADYMGDFDNAVVYDMKTKKKFARPLRGYDENLGFSFTIPGTSIDIGKALESGASQALTNVVSYGVDLINPTPDATQQASQAIVAAQAAQKAAEAQAAAARAQAQAIAAQAQAQSASALLESSQSFVTKYKTPLMIGGGVLGLLVALKVTKVI